MSQERLQINSDGEPWTDGSCAAGLQLPPWERRERYGFLNALYLTVKDVLLAPGRFFQQMPTAVGMKQPLLFAIVIGVAASFMAWLWAMTGSSLQILFRENLGSVMRAPLYSFAIFLFSPLLVVTSTFLQAGLVHLLLMLLDGDRLGFEATLRVCAYSSAVSLLVAIPFCGNAVAVVWSVVVVVLGIYKTHQTEPWKAAVAVILPLVFCLGLLGGGMVFLLATS